MDTHKKKKGDSSDPFAGYLTADERLLWIEGEDRPEPSMAGIYGYAVFGGFIVWLVFISRMPSFAVIVSTSILCLILLMLGGIIVSIDSTMKEIYRPSKGIYALTTKHLFYRRQDRVQEVALGDLPPIYLIPGNGSQGTLNFGDGFPNFQNIDNAAYIKTMIEQAQKEQLNEKNA